MTAEGLDETHKKRLDPIGVEAEVQRVADLEPCLKLATRRAIIFKPMVILTALRSYLISEVREGTFPTKLLI